MSLAKAATGSAPCDVKMKEQNEDIKTLKDLKRVDGDPCIQSENEEAKVHKGCADKKVDENKA